MANETLTASPSVVLFSPSEATGGATKTSTVSWTGEGNNLFIERRNGETPRKIDISDSERAARSFLVHELRSGDLHTVFMFPPTPQGESDPDVRNPEGQAAALLRVDIHAVREQAKLIEEALTEERGGTFVTLTAGTGSKDTRAIFSVGRSITEPVDGVPGLVALISKVFPDEPATTGVEPRVVTSLTPVTTHSLEMTPLVPGWLYTALIVVIDQNGFFDWREFPFETKERTVTGEVTEIRVVDCGDANTGEAEFWVSVFEGGLIPGGEPAQRLITTFNLGNDEFDVINNQQLPIPQPGDLPWTFSMGAKRVIAGANGSVWLVANGREYDGILDDERAGSLQTGLTFPSGKNKENVSNKPETIIAKNETGGPSPFAFKVNFKWSVSYA